MSCICMIIKCSKSAKRIGKENVISPRRWYKNIKLLRKRWKPVWSLPLLTLIINWLILLILWKAETAKKKMEVGQTNSDTL